jgi:hypothetical protein
MPDMSAVLGAGVDSWSVPPQPESARTGTAASAMSAFLELMAR